MEYKLAKELYQRMLDTHPEIEMIDRAGLYLHQDRLAVSNA